MAVEVVEVVKIVEFHEVVENVYVVEVVKVIGVVAVGVPISAGKGPNLVPNSLNIARGAADTGY